MVSATLPDEVRVSGCVVAVFSCTVPNASVEELTVSPGVAAFSCSAALADTPLAVAVRVALCAVVTAEAVAVKPADVAPLATVTDAGTVTALLLLDRFTASPPLPAAEVSVTVQASVAAPVSALPVQESPLSEGMGDPAV
jgi:hypothetical protein